jgi:hypothetical protein
MSVSAESPPIPPPGDRAVVKTGRALRHHPFRVAFALFVGTLAAFGLSYPHWTAHQLSLSFRPQSVPYTELFFPRLNSLPTEMRVGVKTVLPFTIVNREGRTETYHYAVTITGPAGKRVIGTGAVTIDDNAQKVVKAHFVPGLSHASYTVEVTIEPSHEFIEMHGRTK